MFDTILELSGFEAVLLWALFTTANGIAKAFSQGLKNAKNEKEGSRAVCKVCSFTVECAQAHVVADLMDNHYKHSHPTAEDWRA